MEIADLVKKLRRILRRLVPLIVILGAVISGYGGWRLLDFYVYSAPSEFRAPYQIEISWSNITESRQRMAEIALVEESKILFHFYFTMESNGTFITAISLPFRVIESEAWNRTDTGTWYVRDLGQNGTLVYAKDTVKTHWGLGEANNGIVLALNQSLVHDNHGVRTATLSLGGYITEGLNDVLDQLRPRPGLVGAANYTVSFVIPGNAANLQAFPPYSRIRPKPEVNMFEVDWDRIGWETVTLSYAIETEVQSYQDALGWGSFCLALGIPMLLTPIIGWVEQSRSDEALLGAIRSIDLKLTEWKRASEVKPTSSTIKPAKRIRAAKAKPRRKKG